MERKILSVGTVLEKMRKYCAYQDRCHYDVRKKMSEYALTAEEQDWVMCMLIEDKYLDEERFARSFVRGKSSTRAWGTVRIENELKRRGISPKLISMAMEELNQDDYRAKFEAVAAEKIRKVGGIDTLQKRAKVYNYLVSKGYPQDMVWQVLNVK